MTNLIHWMTKLILWMTNLIHWMTSLIHWMANLIHWMASLTHWMAGSRPGPGGRMRRRERRWIRKRWHCLLPSIRPPDMPCLRTCHRSRIVCK